MRHRYVFALAAMAACLMVPATAQAAWSSSILGNNVQVVAAGGNSELLQVKNVTGSFIQHNTLTGLYASDFDWDTTTPGVQTITDSSSISFTIVGGTGDDPVEIDRPNELAPIFISTAPAGTDSPTLDDANSLTAENIAVGSSGVTGYGGGGVTYSNLSGAGEAVHILGSQTGDTIELQSGIPPATSLNAGSGHDIVNIDDGVSTTRKLDGGSGNPYDELDYSDWTTGVTVQMDPTDRTVYGTASGTGGARDFEIITGSEQNDTLSSGPGDVNSDITQLEGLGGADTLTGAGV